MEVGITHRDVSGSFVSMELRMSELVALFDAPATPDSFLDAFKQIQHIRTLGEVFHLTHHPQWRDALDTKRHGSHFVGLAGHLLYGLDEHSQFDTVVHMKSANTERKKGQKRGVVAFQNLLQSYGCQRLSLPSIYLAVLWHTFTCVFRVEACYP